MSNVRVCDRCGRKIKEPGMEIDIRAYKYHRFLLNTEREYSHGCDDLCAICMKEYFAFMDGAEVVRKEKTDYQKIADEVIEMLNMYCDDGNEIYIKKRVLEVNMKSILEDFTNTDAGDETSA